MRWAVLVLCVAADAFSYRSEMKEWSAFKLKNNKHYSSAKEDRDRMRVYAGNKLMVAQHNERYEKGQTTFKLALNQFSDRFDAELQHMNGYRRADDIDRTARRATFSPVFDELPPHKNWSAEGAVTPVKDQGSCGSCWAFSATGALESNQFIAKGELVTLSEQNLMDCSWYLNNRGCCGGDPARAFAYVAENRGIETEESYPYEADDGQCRYDAAVIGAIDYGFVDLPRGNESQLQAAVALIGPISVGIDVSTPEFAHYESGVFKAENCTDQPNHAMLVVGYGTDEVGGDYWLIKNSYGIEWGMDGYIMLARNADNHCGIASDASYPIIKE